jgi:IPT/TIG domain
MFMLALVLGASTVSSGWKWVAVLIGLGAVALVYVFASVSSGSWNPWKLVEGSDGRPSTSKLQWLLWLAAILFAYVVLYAVRAKQGHYDALSRVPVHLLTILGFSTGTAAAAKGITSAYTRNNRLVKPDPGVGNQGGILQDDTGIPELAKIQMMGFTFVALGIFFATLAHHIVSNPPNTQLPDVDASLLVLMGISQGGYLGKKLVTFGSPLLFAPATKTVQPGGTVTLEGAGLGTQASGSVLTVNEIPIAPTSLSDTSVVFNVPAVDPVTQQAWVTPKTIRLAVISGGQSTNTVLLQVT